MGALSAWEESIVYLTGATQGSQGEPWKRRSTCFIEEGILSSKQLRNLLRQRCTCWTTYLQQALVGGLLLL